MNIADNVLQSSHKNVYFVSGTACAGKSTMSKIIAEELGMELYNVDDHFGEYHELSDKTHQPEMNLSFSSWEEYFSREPRDYSNALSNSMRECLDFAIVDLIKLSQNKKVIVEGFFPVGVLTGIVSSDQCVYLFADYELLRRNFFDREDKKDLYECIMAQKDPETMLKNVLDAVTYDYFELLEEVKSKALKYFVRTETTDYSELKSQMIKSLGLS